eukprot:2016131-Alexandrium_andersonii.AAC.1
MLPTSFVLCLRRERRPERRRGASFGHGGVLPASHRSDGRAQTQVQGPPGGRVGLAPRPGGPVVEL